MVNPGAQTGHLWFVHLGLAIALAVAGLAILAKDSSPQMLLSPDGAKRTADKISRTKGQGQAPNFGQIGAFQVREIHS